MNALKYPNKKLPGSITVVDYAADLLTIHFQFRFLLDAVLASVKVVFELTDRVLSAEVHYLSDRMGRRLLFQSDIFLFSLSSGVTVLETRACFLLRRRFLLS